MLITRINRMVRSADTGASGGGEAAPVTTPAPDAAAAPTAEFTPTADALKQAGVTTGVDQSLLSTSAEPPAGEGDAAKPPEGDAAKTDEAKKDDAAAPVEMKPEDYDLTYPEGINPDSELVQDFLAGAAKGGMDKESAQALLDVLGPKLAEQLNAPHKAWQEMNANWAAEIKADPEIGGTNLAKTVDTVHRAIALVSTPEEATAVKHALTLTGFGNNPVGVRLLHRMATRLVESKGPVTGATAAPVPSLAERLYPSAAKRG